MAGTRRGAERRDASDAFEAANPFLARVDTTLEVALEDASEWGYGSGTEEFPWGYGSSEEVDWDPVEDIPDVPVPLVTQDGQEVDFFDGFFRDWPGFSTSSRITTPVGDLDSDTSDDEDSSISLSAYGFGVLSEDEEYDLYGVLMDEDPDMGAFALNDDEVLEFDIDVPFMIRPRGLEMYDEDGGPDQGGISLEIEYLVLGGTGQVGVQIEEQLRERYIPKEFEGPLDPAVVEVLSGQLSEGDTGTLSATMTDGLFFEDGEIFVEGGLEVAIVGITVTTNFAGELAEP